MRPLDTYYLFLDELKANDTYKNFCLGGCVIEDVIYRQTIIPYMQGLKHTVYNNPNKVLHEADTGDNNKPLWDGMRKLFKEHDITVLCVAVDNDSFHAMYRDKGHVISSEYYIALQIILENFVHFLVEKNGRGCVYIESRGLIDDMRLQEQYDLVKKNGTLFMPSKVFQERLYTISFPMKADNNIGLQIADFIPNPVARQCGGLPQKPNSIIDVIQSKAYDGNNALINRFGIKKVL